MTDIKLPISKGALLEALNVAIKQAHANLSMIVNLQEDIDIGSPSYIEHPIIISEIQSHIEYLEQLHQNIKDDACSNYPPVVRKG